IARTLAQEGCNIAICARERTRLDAAAKEIAEETGRTILPIVADLTKPEDAKNFIDSAVKHFKRLDILVNNAGSAPGGVLETLTEEDWALSLQLKFMGYVRCTKAAIPHMRLQGK